MLKIGMHRCVLLCSFLALASGCVRCDRNRVDGFSDVVRRVGTLIRDYEEVGAESVSELATGGGRHVTIDITRRHEHVADKEDEWRSVSASLAVLVSRNHDMAIADDAYLLLAFVDQVLSQGGKNDRYAVSALEAYQSYVRKCQSRTLEDDTRRLLKRTRWLSVIEAYLSMCPPELSESEKMGLYAQEQIAGIQRMRKRVGSALDLGLNESSLSD